MFNKDGILIIDPKEILQEIERFYSDLYKAASRSLKPSENLLNYFLENPEIPRLKPAIRREITVAECLKSL